MRHLMIALILSIFCILLPIAKTGNAASSKTDFVVYSIYRGLNLGNPDESVQKDYYVNMGSMHGLHEGSILEVMRRNPTYNLLSEQHYKDVVFPIARIKVIHVESIAAIARLQTMLPVESTPTISPRAVMVGDLVRIPEH